MIHHRVLSITIGSKTFSITPDKGLVKCMLHEGGHILHLQGFSSTQDAANYLADKMGDPQLANLTNWK